MKKRQPKLTITIEGDKVTLTMEGGVPPIIAQSLPEVVASALRQISTSTPPKLTKGTLLVEADSWTVREKVRYIVLRYCRHGWFTSRDVKELYDRTFHPSIALATVSTYLSRMHRSGILSRRGSAAQREYRVNIEELTDEIAAIAATEIKIR